jgi:hypothetical protein
LWVKITGRDEKEHKTTAMIDCEATENFIDRRFAEQLGLPLTKKLVPRKVLTVDGRELEGGLVTHDAMVTMVINDHREEIRLHCITIGNSPIIIGLPWLRKHNPNIDWKEGKITFNSEKCGKNCLPTSPHATTVPERGAEEEYDREVDRNSENAYGIVSEGQEGTTQTNNNNEESELRIQEIWEECGEEEEEDEDKEEDRDGFQKHKRAEPTEDDPSPVQPTLRQIPQAPTNQERPVQWEPSHKKSINTPRKLEFAGAVTRVIQTEQGSHHPLEGIVPPEYADYLSVFREKEAVGLPPHRHHDHHIPLLEGRVPPFEPLRALDEDRLRVLRDYLDENEKRGWIRRSMSPAGAPIHFVKKKDGTLRLCVDYRRLNEITIKDRTLLPLIGEALDRLSHARIYTKLDVRDAYHNLRIATGDEWKTAFRTKYGLYKYRVMPFSLTNAPASFQ